MTLLQAMLELNRIEAAITDKQNKIQERNTITDTIVNEEQNFPINVDSEIAEVRQLWTDLFSLLDQKARLQEGMTIANAKAGLDVLLSKRNFVKSTIKRLSMLTARNRYTAPVKCRTTHTPYSTDKGGYWQHSITAQAVSEAEIEEQITLLKNELQELEAKIATLNNQPFDF